MPNYCYNLLTIDGPAEEVTRFIKENEGESNCAKSPLAFNALVPYPEEPHEYGESTDWADENWGTDYLETAEEWRFAKNSTEAAISFITPYTPPLEWAGTVSRLFPKLKYRLLGLADTLEVFASFSWKNGVLRTKDLSKQLRPKALAHPSKELAEMIAMSAEVEEFVNLIEE